MDLKTEVKAIKGIGNKKAGLLEKLNIYTIEDFLKFYPRTYQDRRNVQRMGDLTSGESALVRGTVATIFKDRFRAKHKQLLRLIVTDGTGGMEVVFFNAKYLADKFEEGEEYDFYGKVIIDYGKVQMLHPDFVKKGKGTLQGIIPVYQLTAGISQSEMRKWQSEAAAFAYMAEEYLPSDIIKRNNLCDISYALSNIHFPTDEIKLKEARFRLVFEELLTLQTGLLYIRGGKSKKGSGISFSPKIDVREYIDSLSYKLTAAQYRTLLEIVFDMESDYPMNRLVQGDVGSGKTVIAEAALFKAAKCGYQGVLMAPTEILAKQHYEGISDRFAAFGIKTEFISGSLGKKEREERLGRLKSGETQVIIGTHAVIQPDVEFENLGLVITDEQHRFGVKQRSVLRGKGKNPDILVMTATPIPRTLAVILYGDLDISLIDEIPPGRQKITTRAVDEKGREASYKFIKSQIQEGRQAYVVTPLIDDSEALDIRSAESVYEKLKKDFSDYNVALLHGEMKQKEKDEIMSLFYEGHIHVLVSTVIIEVGINVPNATVMLIENAERFGLAQMHQLRGRVGRGSHRSYCILITEGKSRIAKERAEIMVSTSDGFVIAEKDLELRGPGEIFGTKQHGIPALAIADLVKHKAILETVKEEAKSILSEDPKLSGEKYKAFKEKIQEFMGGELNLNL